MPVGATGSVVSCAEQGKQSAPLRGRLALTTAYTRSYLTFGSSTLAEFDLAFDRDVTFDRMTVVLENDFFVDKFSISVIAGGIPIGALSAPDQQYAFGPGWLLGANISWRVLEQKGDAPYIMFNASLGAAGATTRPDSMITNVAADGAGGNYYAVDFRFGATAGKTFDGWFSPYMSFRVFGGPIFWDPGDGEYRLGTDRYHIQPAIGAVLILPKQIDLFVEGTAVGEQGVSLGLGWSYF